MSGNRVVHSDSTTSDCELLQRIAGRDLEAFTIFYKRHERFLYGMALRVARDRLAAEEAFQEAVTKIWVSAGNFRVAGNAKGWITRILVRECLRLRRRSREQPLELAGPLSCQPKVDGEPTTWSTEHQELLGRVWMLIRELPDEDQRILVLHYVGGLTQVEIGRVLGLRQTTISRRLTKSLDYLRSKMAGAGCGLAGVAGLEELLGLACTAHLPEPPSALAAQALARPFASNGQEAPSPGPRFAAPLLCAAGALALLTLLGFALISGAGSRPTRQAAAGSKPVPLPTLAPEPGTGQPGPLPGRFRRAWSFEQGIPAELQPFENSWSHWEPARAGLAAAAVAKRARGSSVCVRLPVEIPAVPLWVRIRVRSTPPDFPTQADLRAGLNFSWISEGNRFLSHRFRKVRGLFKGELDRALDWDLFLYRQFTLVKYHEALHPLEIREYASAYPSTRLALTVFGYAVERFSIEEIAESEVPELLRDPQAMLRISASDPESWFPPALFQPPSDR